MKPRLLDLFCGAGGAAMGYHRAGFEVVGVDIKPQPHYPFEFIQGDALDILGGLAGYGLDRPGSRFAAIHASPPCQAYTQSALRFRNEGKEYPDLLEPTRQALIAIGLPWVIENVPGAPMRADYVLCGCQFQLPNLRRERWFETSWHGFALHPTHDHTEPAISVVGHGTPSWVRSKLGYNPTIAQYRAAMGIDWMNRNELSQAIPPAYTEWIGTQLLATLERAA
jgi:DNA (cytosine-5)-methyltransferase 1